MRSITLAFALVLAVGSSELSHAEEPVDYVRDIKPILSNSCFTCHGPDDDSRAADLRLDERMAAVAGAIEPGNADASELILRITSDDPDYRMPPDASRRPRPTDRQVDLLRRWINEGSNYSKHWAYLPPQRLPPPQLSEDYAQHAANPIDYFVLAKLERGIHHTVSSSRRAYANPSAVFRYHGPAAKSRIGRHGCEADRLRFRLPHPRESTLESPGFRRTLGSLLVRRGSLR